MKGNSSIRRYSTNPSSIYNHQMNGYLDFQQDINNINTEYSSEEIDFLLMHYVGDSEGVKVYKPQFSSLQTVMNDIANILIDLFDQREIFETDDSKLTGYIPIGIRTSQGILWSLLVTNSKRIDTVHDQLGRNNQSPLPILFIPHANLNKKRIDKIVQGAAFPSPKIKIVEASYEHNEIIASGAWIIEVAAKISSGQQDVASSRTNVNIIKTRHFCDLPQNLQANRAVRDSTKFLVKNGLNVKKEFETRVTTYLKNVRILELKFLLGVLNKNERQNFVDEVLKNNKEVVKRDFWQLYLDILNDLKINGRTAFDVKEKGNFTALIQSLMHYNVSRNISLLISKLEEDSKTYEKSKKTTSPGFPFGQNLSIDLWNALYDLSKKVFKRIEQIISPLDLDKAITDAIKKIEQYNTEDRFKIYPVVLLSRIAKIEPIYYIIKKIEENETIDNSNEAVILKSFGLLTVDFQNKNREDLLEMANYLTNNNSALRGMLLRFGHEARVAPDNGNLAQQEERNSCQVLSKFFQFEENLYMEKLKETDVSVQARRSLIAVRSFQNLSACGELSVIKNALLELITLGQSEYCPVLSAEVVQYPEVQQIINNYFQAVFFKDLSSENKNFVQGALDAQAPTIISLQNKCMMQQNAINKLILENETASQQVIELKRELEKYKNISKTHPDKENSELNEKFSLTNDKKPQY